MTVRLDRPHNITAEQVLLGCALQDRTHLEQIADTLNPDDFYDPLHIEIYATMLALHSANRVANEITLRTEFEGHPPIRPEPPATGPDLPVPEYLARLRRSAIGRGAHVADHVKTVSDLARRRDLIRICQNTMVAAMDAPVDHPPESLLAGIEAELFALGEGRRVQGVIDLPTTMDCVLHYISDAYQRGGVMAGLSTGLVDLDRKLGGLQASDLIIMAGRPSMGKTALALDVANHLARHGTPVGAFSLEMSGAQLGLRMLAQRVEIASDLLRRGDITMDQFRTVAHHAQEIAKLPLRIDESGGLTLAQLSSRARRMKRQHGIQVLVVDYLQLMAGSGRENRTQDVTEITMGLKALAKELAIPVIALSQLSRKVEERADKRPQLADLRDSGSIEQDADVVLFVFREEYYIERAAPDPSDLEAVGKWQARLARAAGRAELIIAKNRNGSPGVVPVAFNAALTQFGNLAQENAYEAAREAV